jgi:serine/threonine protein kinase
MTPARWQQIEDLYNQALEVEENQRTAFLRQACAGDDDLRQEVEGLLADELQVPSFLGKPALQEIARQFAETATSSWVGREIGNYQFVSLAGAGGMGEVYRARDTKLKREVAIKVLPEEFSSHQEWVSRFQHEAELLASLNHPNIAAIYDLEEDNGLRFLILELVEGETLQERLNRGPIPLDDAIQIAAKIAEGLAAAHERGIIHRDLKPANIKLTPEGKVKILDFGLAKVFTGEGTDLNLLNSPTNAPASTPGTLVGTAAYMSPEQAQGKPADKRADIWAFGVVLYEMLVGRRLFKDESLADTLAAVLTKEPEWDRVPARALPLLRRCLVRDPHRRLRDIGDAMPLVDSMDNMPQLVPSRRPRLTWSVAVLFLLGFSLLSFIYFRKTPPQSVEPTRFKISLPDKLNFALSGTFAVSPDGRRLVYWAQGADNVARLWLQDLNVLEPRLLPGTESTAAVTGPPFWSPDGRFVVFDSGGKLRQADVTSGAVQIISEVSSPFMGGSWNNDDVIIIGNGNGGIRRVAAGGQPSALTVLDPSRQEIAHLTPYFLPDGRHFLYHRLSNTLENSGIYLGSLDAKPEEQSSKQIVASKAGPVYVRSRGTSAGQLLFLRGTTLFAQTFDTTTMELTGEPVAVAEQVGDTNGSMALFSSSANGVLVYKKVSGRDLQLTWYDRQGSVLGTVGEPAPYSSLRLSPDGARAIVSRTDPRSENQDLYLLDLSGKTAAERFTTDPGRDLMPVWSPNGSHIAFLSYRSGGIGLYQKASSGPVREERLQELGSLAFLSDWSRDGRFLAYAIEGGPRSGADLWLLPLNGAREPIPFARKKFRENFARFSPDMRWIAYMSNETRRAEIYVQPFSASPDAGTSATVDTWKVSREGGTMPRWREDGKELYFLDREGKVMAVEITTNPVFHHGAPMPLFQLPASFLTTGQGLNLLGDVSADGKRFLFAIPLKAPEELAVVLNWTSELKK